MTPGHMIVLWVFMEPPRLEPGCWKGPENDRVL